MRRPTGADRDLDRFLELSAELTGFAGPELFASDQAETYFAAAKARVEPATFAALLQVWSEIREAAPAERRAAVTARILGAQGLGDAARRINMLWYTGSWFVATPYDGAVLSAQSYVEGLVWKAIGAHPMAAKPQGFGAWALPPPQGPSGAGHAD